MRSRRVMRTWLPAVVVSVAVGVSPGAAFATGGPSAGDNQYTDPLAGQNGQTTTHHSTPPPKTTTSSSPAPPAPQPATPAAPAPTATAAGTPTTTTPTATAASSGASTSSKADPKTLPLTGFDAGLGAALGIVMLGLGLFVRRRVTA